MTDQKKLLLIYLIFFITAPLKLFSQASTVTNSSANNAIEKFGLLEAEFVADSTYNNPYVEVTLSANIAGPGGIAFDVEGYWAGANIWRLRIMPTAVGQWTYTTVSNDPGLDSLSGTFDCMASSRPGILMVNPDYPYTFKLSEGEPFFWLGETSWCLMSNAAPFNDGTFQKYITKRIAQRFNGIHFVLGTGGLPHGTKNPANEGGNLWLSQREQRINPGFFTWMDKRLAYLDSMQMAVGFFITWSQHFASFSRDEFERLERYLIARYAAYPLLYWVIVGEYDEAGTIEDYNYHGKVFDDRDPYGHLVSNHPNHHDLQNLGTSRIFAGQDWFDFVLQQLPRYPVKDSPAQVHQYILNDRSYNMPVVNDEFGYEERDYYGKILTSDYVRKYAWSIVLGGGFFSYGHEKTIRAVDLSGLETEGVAYVGHLYDFFKDLSWWEMNPDTDKVNNGFCLARAAPEYIIYLPDSGLVTIDLTQDLALLMASWYDPKSGTYGDTLVLQGGSMQSFDSPFPDDAVLHLFPNVKPIIQVEPDYLFFQGREQGINPPDQTITITNIGGGTMSWSAKKQPDVPWLNMNPTSGGSGDQMIVSIDPANQIAGVYYDTIRICDSQALNNPVTVPVTLKLDSLAFIAVLSPNGGEVWEVNSVQAIKWRSQNTSGAVKLEYSSDNGSTYTAIDSFVPDNHHYTWKIPDYPSSACLVKITDVAGDPFGQSDSVFTISEPLDAEFIGTPVFGTRPLTVRFTDQSTGLIDSWYWQFGDGTSSTSQHPIHRYWTAGTYTVSLTVTGVTGQNTETRSHYVKVFERQFIISGAVSYFNQSRPVAGSIINLTHADGTCADTTDAVGCYWLEAIPQGNIQLAPLKPVEPGNFVSGLDAFLVLQYLTPGENLTEGQKLAADVTEDGKVNCLDAQAILSYLTFSEEMRGSTGQWRFTPDTLAFNLQADTIIDCKAFLLGDVNGDWQAAGENDQKNNHPETKPDSTATILKIGEARTSNKDIFSVPVKIANLEEQLQALLLTIDYEPQLLKYLTAQKTNLKNKLLLVTNGAEPGRLHLAMADAPGMMADGEIARLLFSAKNPTAQNGYTELKITRAKINDKSVVTAMNGRIYFGDNESESVPQRFVVFQNHPNPFNQSTKICFDLPLHATVALNIYNVLGQKVATPVNGRLPAASHQITWNGVDELGEPLNSGIYFYQIKVMESDTENGIWYSVMKKMFLLK